MKRFLFSLACAIFLVGCHKLPPVVQTIPDTVSEADLEAISKYEDLSEEGWANCYIINKAGDFRFKVYKGNSSTVLTKATKAEVLWESFGTDVAPKVGEIIKSVDLKARYVIFSTPSELKNGNAVIAVKNASGNILWSWHIWVCEDYKVGSEADHYYGQECMMDRNLGATSADPDDPGAIGLVYQWGRKDPFMGSYSTSSCHRAASTITWPDPVDSDSSTGDESFVIHNPTTFVKANSQNHDWYYTGDNTTDETRWRDQYNAEGKGLYDPCPRNWQVPDGYLWLGTNAVDPKYWTIPSNYVGLMDTGIDFSRIDKKFGLSGPIWYPAAGYSTDGSLSDVGTHGRYWSSTSYTTGSPNVIGLSFTTRKAIESGEVNLKDNFERGIAMPVRCLWKREEKKEE